MQEFKLKVPGTTEGLVSGDYSVTASIYVYDTGEAPVYWAEWLGKIISFKRKYQFGHEEVSGLTHNYMDAESFRRDLAEWVDDELADRIEWHEYHDTPELEELIRRLVNQSLVDRMAVLIPIITSGGMSNYTLWADEHGVGSRNHVGYMFATKEDVREWYGVQRISRKTTQKARAMLISQLETLNQYHDGNSWYAITTIYKRNTCPFCECISLEEVEELASGVFIGDVDDVLFPEISGFLGEYGIEAKLEVG